jgi:hypothetical protein
VPEDEISRGLEPPEGSWQTTTLIGRVWKGSNALS